MKELKSKEVLEITGDEDRLKEYYTMVINAWYINNLLSLPPHSMEEAQTLKDLKMEEIKRDKKQMLNIEDGF
jgi:hypothetical protein